MTPAGISREAVRGLRASMWRSAQRLKPMATLQAKTMQPTTCMSSMGSESDEVSHVFHA